MTDGGLTGAYETAQGTDIALSQVDEEVHDAKSSFVRQLFEYSRKSGRGRPIEAPNPLVAQPPIVVCSSTQHENTLPFLTSTLYSFPHPFANKWHSFQCPIVGRIPRIYHIIL